MREKRRPSRRQYRASSFLVLLPEHRWYQLGFYPGSAPTLTANDTTSGFVDVYFTGARVVIEGATITFIIPVSELPSNCPAQRVTAFTHHGDYGFQPPNFWAGDTEPTVFDPLEPVCSE